MPAKKTSAPKPAPQAVVAVPWQILLPLNWRDALTRGKLAATLAVATGSEISPADDRLCAWLAKEGVARKEILSLNLDGARVPAFLGAIAEHPRLAAGANEHVELRAMLLGSHPMKRERPEAAQHVRLI